MSVEQNREFLSAMTSLPLGDVCRRLQERIGLAPFESPVGDDSFATSSRDGISYSITRTGQESEDGCTWEIGIVIAIWDECTRAQEPDWSGDELVPAFGRALAIVVNGPVTFCRSWRLDGSNRARARVFCPHDPEIQDPARDPPEPAPASRVCLTSIGELRPRHQGPLDFAFLVHPRDEADLLRSFPELRLCPRPHVDSGAHSLVGAILSAVEVRTPAGLLRGEILSVTRSPAAIQENVPRAREDVGAMLAYAASRRARVVGLGALLPALTRHGALFANRPLGVGLTTGHTFTALAILRYVRRLEAARGPLEPLAVVGAAGSMGRAVTRLLIRDRPTRHLVLHDLPTKLGGLAGTPGFDPSLHDITADRVALRSARLVITVTNAPGAVLSPDVLGRGCVILDDAQPENVSYETLSLRPDLTVIKCLARVRGLWCPLDFGLFGLNERGTEEVTFTCLAETVALAAAGHHGNFTIGDPSDGQLAWLDENSERLGIDIAPLHSFPEIGFLEPE